MNFSDVISLHTYLLHNLPDLEIQIVTIPENNLLSNFVSTLEVPVMDFHAMPVLYINLIVYRPGITTNVDFHSSTGYPMEVIANSKIYLKNQLAYQELSILTLRFKLFRSETDTRLIIPIDKFHIPDSKTEEEKRIITL